MAKPEVELVSSRYVYGNEYGFVPSLSGEERRRYLHLSDTVASS